MKLSTTQFERIIKEAHGGGHGNVRPALVPAGCRVAQERRTSPRVSMGRRVQMRVGSDGRWQTAVVRDVCETGLSVLTDFKLAAGDLFVVRFQTGPGQHLCVESRVCWSEAGGYGHVGYLAGAVFERLIEHQAYVVQPDYDDDVVAVQTAGMVEMKPGRGQGRRRLAFGVTDAVSAVFGGLARAIGGRRPADDFH
jgi:hypothetical protein